MKSISRFLMIFLALIIVVEMNAQVSSRTRSRTASSKNQDKSISFVDHLWYGGGFGLSFSNGFGGLAGNVFSVGLSPMVGYKLNRIFSVGPRLQFQYTNGRFQQFPGSPVAKYNGFDYGAGLFGRARILPFIFAHAEVGYINQQYPTGFISQDKLETARQGDNQFLAGLGYTSGGLWKTEIYLLYDFLNNIQSTQLPIVYRFGLTYKF